jgi:hypothetical protein
MVGMAALVLRPQDLNSLFRGDPARAARVVFGHEAGERLAHDQADVQWQAGIGAGRAAGAVQDDKVIGILQDDVAGAGVGDDLFQVFDSMGSCTVTSCAAD